MFRPNNGGNNYSKAKTFNVKNSSSDLMNSLLKKKKENESSRFLWHGEGTGVAWASKREQIVQAFMAANCWELIDPHNAPPGDRTLPGYSMENSFTEPDIDVNAMVNQREADQLTRIHNLFATNEAVINGSTVSGAEKGKLMMQETLTRNKKLSEIEEDRLKVTSTFIAQKNERTKRKDDFEEKQANTIKCFRQVFSPDSLAPVKHLLSAFRVREAWEELNQKNGLDVSGAAVSTTLVRQITEYKYNKDYTMDQNIQYLRLMQDQLKDAHGVDYPAAMLVIHLREGIAYSPAHGDIKSAALLSKNNNEDWDSTVKRLREAAGLVYVKLNTQRNNNTHHNDTDKRDENAAMVKALKKQVKRLLRDDHVLAAATTDKRQRSDRWCSVCKTDKHDESKCFTKVPCSNCGELGHGHWQHKCKTENTKGTDGNHTSVGGLFRSNVSARR